MASLTQTRVLVLGGTPSHPGGVESFCAESAQSVHQFAAWRVDRLPTNTAYPTLRTLPRIAKGLLQLVAYSRHRPHCVWLQYVNLADLSFLLVARLLGMRVMVTPHLGANWRSQRSPLLRWVSKLILGRAHRISLISPTQGLEIALPTGVPESLIRNFLPEPTLAVPLPATTNQDSRLRLLHSGRLSRGKGSFAVIEVCAGLRDRGVDFRAFITGGADQDTFDELDQLIAQHGVGDYVEVLGRVSDDRLRECMLRADVLVHLSTIDSYPLIVLEAMACGTMPVCIDLAGARDMVETYGGHIVAESRAVESTITYLEGVELDRLRQEGSRAALRVRIDYSRERCAQALVSALEDCIDDDPRRANGPSAAAT